MLTGCEPESLRPTWIPTSPGTSGALVYSENSGLAYFADTDRGTVGIFDPRSGQTTHVEVGGEPHKLCLTSERVFVTQRATRSLVSFLIEGESLRFERRIEVGAEPGSVVTDSRGEIVYVAVSLEDVVAVVDVNRGEVTERIGVWGRPEWLLVHQDLLWVGTRRVGRESALVLIDPARHETEPLAMPKVPTLDGEAKERVVRITGDPVAAADGFSVFVPVSYTPASSVPGSVAFDTTHVLDPVVPGIVRIPVSAGRPLASSALAMLTIGPGLEAIAVSPSGHKLAFSGMSARSVGLLSTPPLAPLSEADEPFRRQGGRSFDLSAPALDHTTRVQPAAAPSGLGTRGLIFIGPDRVLAYSAFEFSMVDLDLSRSEEEPGLNPWALGRKNSGTLSLETFMERMLARRFLVSEARLDESVSAGRALFYDGEGGAVSGSGNVSCASCHPEGGSDGLTWDLPEGRFQTPVTRGASQSLPLRWFGDRSSVQEHVRKVANDLMAARRDLVDEAELVARYIESLRDLDVPDLEPDASARGRVLFEAAETECAVCHQGDRLTDGKLHPSSSRSLLLNTPSLIGVVASAPYLSDGRAETLEAAVTEHERDGLGRVSHLSAGELSDLVAFLRSR